MQYVFTSLSLASPEEEEISESMPFEEAKQVFAECLNVEAHEIQVPEGRSTCADVEETVIGIRPATTLEVLGDMDDLDDLSVDDIVGQFSEERMEMAFKRAEREFGGLVADYESEEFEEEFHNQLKLMAAKDIYDELIRKGVIETVGVDEEGHVRYDLTPEGHKELSTD